MPTKTAALVGWENVLANYDKDDVMVTSRILESY